MFDTRSKQMVRCKQELKKELLSAMTHKPRQLKDRQYHNHHSDPINMHKSPKSHDYSILDEFSKCPYLESEESSAKGEVLNMFMHPKQTHKSITVNLFQKENQSNSTNNRVTEAAVQTVNYFPPFQATHSKNEKQTLSTIHPYSRTPLKKEEEKSLINVSKNLSNLKYGDSHEKEQDNQILTESILRSQKKDNSHNDLEKVKQEIKKDEEAEKGPIVKQITLSKSNKGKDKFTFVEDLDQSKEEQECDEKLRKMLTKKSSIKDLIQKSNSNSNPVSQKIEQGSKWQKKEGGNRRERRQEKEIEDLLDLFPPYESSSSGLQAVIEEENSEMEESIQARNEAINSQKNMQQNSQRVVNFIKKATKEQSDIKSVSLSDLSLEDVSEIEIQNRSGNKNFINLSSLKKISSGPHEKSLIEHGENMQLEKSKDEIKIEQKIQASGDNTELEKFILNDIGSDISGLQRKIQSDFDSDSFRNAHVERSSSEQGSEGPSQKSNSILQIFDKMNEKLNFHEISKDLLDLRDRMQNSSFS